MALRQAAAATRRGGDVGGETTELNRTGAAEAAGDEADNVSAAPAAAAPDASSFKSITRDAAAAHLAAWGGAVL